MNVRSTASILLAAIMLLLAFRLTCTESLRETIRAKADRVQAEARAAAGDQNAVDELATPEIGPAYIAAYVALSFLIAGITSILALRVNALTQRHSWQFALIAVILALLAASAMHAANRFNATIGTADIAAALVSAWALGLLCHPRMLGDRGRSAAIAAIIAILAIGCLRGLYQRYMEYPEFIQYVHDHLEEALRQAHMSDDPASRTLFLSRVNSAAVRGFGALENVFATQLMAFVALLAGLLVAGVPLLANLLQRTKGTPLTATRNPSQKVPKPRAPRGEIPLPLIAYIILAILFIAGVWTLPLTQSKGGFAAGMLAIVLIAVGWTLRTWIARHRRLVIAGTAAAALLMAAAVLGYGFARHTLPTKSLMFRWQYWTATMPIIKREPLLGVGLNNFGDYYLQTKSPSYPEDVKDPHNFFIRLAAETGIPATLAVSALLLWFALGACRRSSAANQAIPEKLQETRDSRAPYVLAGAAALAWVPLHLLAEAPNTFSVSMTIIDAIMAWAAFAAAYCVMEELRVDARGALRFCVLAAATAALAMLLYDQVNMALVTGSVAMLFWILLAMADSAGDADAPEARQVKTPVMLWSVPALAMAAGIAALFALAMPIARGTFPLDPAPYEYAYIRALEADHPQAALDELDNAITLAPNSVELRVQRVVVKRDRLKQPVADDIRQALLLDRANARIRIDLAMPNSDLPAKERAAILEEALKCDDALANDEPKKLQADERKKIQEKIADLK